MVADTRVIDAHRHPIPPSIRIAGPLPTQSPDGGGGSTDGWDDDDWLHSANDDRYTGGYIYTPGTGYNHGWGGGGMQSIAVFLLLVSCIQHDML